MLITMLPLNAMCLDCFNWIHKLEAGISAGKVLRVCSLGQLSHLFGKGLSNVILKSEAWHRMRIFVCLFKKILFREGYSGLHFQGGWFRWKPIECLQRVRYFFHLSFLLCFTKAAGILAWCWETSHIGDAVMRNLELMQQLWCLDPVNATLMSMWVVPMPSSSYSQNSVMWFLPKCKEGPGNGLSHWADPYIGQNFCYRRGEKNP